MRRSKLLVPLLVLALASLGLYLAAGLGDPVDEPALPGDAPSEAPAGDGPEALAGLEGSGPGPTAGTGGARTGATPEGVRLAGEGRLSGVVRTAEDGSPVAGLAVQLLPVPPASRGYLARMYDLVDLWEGADERLLPVATTTSDAQGRFAFEGVREGAWYVDAVGPFHLRENPVHARVLPSGDGGPVEVRVRTGGHVRGTVVDEDARPVGGARVMLTTGAGEFLAQASAGDLALHETRTAADGTFAFLAVAPGDAYEVSAIGPGMTVSHRTGVQVREGRETEVLLHGSAGAEVRGRVLSAPSPEHGGQRLPLEGARVAAVPRGLRHLRFAREVLEATAAETDAEGRYVLRGVPPGETDLLAMAEDHAPGRGAMVRAVRGGVHEAADLELERGPTVAGRVVDGTGNPIAGAQVRWWLAPPDDMRGEVTFAPLLVQAMKEWDFPVTDAQGRFLAGPFPGPAPYALLAVRPGFGEAQVSWDPADGPGPVTIVLARGGSVEGIVMDLDTGEPVPDFRVETRDRVELEAGAPGRLNPFSGGFEFEDSGGRFRLDALRAPAAALEFHAAGYRTARIEVPVTEGQPTRGIIVSLSRGGVVRGRVVDGEGEPVRGAQVTSEGVLADFQERLRRDRDRARDEYNLPIPRGRGNGGPETLVSRFGASLGLVTDGVATTDAEGRFELTGLEPGAQRLYATHRAYRPATSGALSVSPGTPVEDVELVLTEGGGLTGRVTDRFDRPVEGAMVVALAPTFFTGARTAGVHQGLTDAAGRYTIRHMEAGGYFLVLTRGDEALSPMSFLGTLNVGLVTVPESGLVTHDIVDTSAGACRVHGRVLGPDGPLSRGSLVALGFEAEGLLGIDFKVANVESDGRYAFQGLAPGEYRLELQGAGARTSHVVEVPDAPELRYDFELPRGLLAGEVVDRATGAPVSGARVRVRRVDGPTPAGMVAQMISRDGQRRNARTGDDGRFELERLGAGRYELSVDPPDSGVHAPHAALEVELSEGERRDDLVFRLDPGRTLAGRVTDAETGAPVPGARVVVRVDGAGAARPVSATADEQGDFEARGLARKGRADLRVEAEGFAPTLLEDLDLAEAEGTPVAVELRRGSLVQLRVVDAQGRPVAGAAARLVLAGDADVAEEGGAGSFFRSFFGGDLVTDSEGRLDLGRHGAGEHLLEVGRGSSRVQRTVTLTGQDPAVELKVILE